MKQRYTLALIPILLVLTANAQNTCSTPLPVGAGLYTVAAVDGTDVPLPVCSTGGTGATAGEWYSYTATSNVQVTVSTDLVENGNTDTRVQIYSGSCGALSCVGGDDDSGAGLLSIATFNASAGTTYRIAFDNRYSSGGFDFTVSEQPWDPMAINFSNLVVAVNGSAYAVVDMNNDGRDDIVSVTSTIIRIHYQQLDGSLVPVDVTTTAAAYTPSWSMAVGDIDGNGFLDLLYGGGSGVTFMYANADGSAFTQVSGPQYVFSQRSNFVDINNDGHLDAFVCHDVQPNVYYLNDGTGNLTFVQGGLGNTPDGGNYGSIWIDYNNDHHIDMFIAKCRGGQTQAAVDQMHRNNGDGTYTEVGMQLGFADYHQSWSSAWGDFDNDGDMDVMIGASSFAEGGHKLMRNDGDVFTDISIGSGLDVFQGTSTEWTAHDFDNDGYVDILGASSTIHRNNGDMTFTPQPVAASSGPIGDLNNDGFLDVLNGGTIRLNTGNTNNWIRVNLQGTMSNRNGIGARVEIVSALGTQIRDIKSGDGFRYMSFIGAHFGLGTDTEVSIIRVYWPSGQVDVVENPPINGALLVTESISTGVEAAGANGLVLYPNPATDFIRVGGDLAVANRNVRILDAAGKEVLNTTVRNGRVDISALNSGAYHLQLEVDGSVHQRSFNKH